MKYEYSIFDLVPYFFLLVLFYFVLLTKLVDDKQKNKILFFLLLIFTVIRYDVGFDYFMYENIIKTGTSERFEYLSKAILDFGNYIDFFPLPFAVFGYLSLIFVKKTFDDFSLDSAMSWFAYLGLPFLFAASLSTIRQAVAVSLILYSFKFAISRKYMKFTLVIVISALFHSSGIVGMLLYFLCRIKFGKKALLIILISSFFIGALFESLLLPNLNAFFPDERFSYYVEHAEDNYKSTTVQYVFYVIAFINLFLYNKLVKINDLNRVFILVSTFGVVAFNILNFEPNSAFRIGGFFMSFWILIVPSYQFLDRAYTIKINRKLIKVVSSSFFVIIIAIIISSNIRAYLAGSLPKASFVPYRTWFNNLN